MLSRLSGESEKVLYNFCASPRLVNDGFNFLYKNNSDPEGTRQVTFTRITSGALATSCGLDHRGSEAQSRDQADDRKQSTHCSLLSRHLQTVLAEGVDGPRGAAGQVICTE